MDQIYENKPGVEQIKSESQVFWTVDKITVSGGIKQWITGASFPSRGMTSPETMFACNQVKRIVVEMTKLFSWRLLLVKPSRIIESFNEVTWRVISPYIIKYEYLTPVAQEIQDISYSFLIRRGLKDDIALRFSKIFSHLIEYDNAYRYRFQDLLNESTKHNMVLNPRAEIKFLIKKLSERDGQGMVDKFNQFASLLRLILLVPSIKRDFVAVIEDSNFSKLQVDEIDWYWMCQREEYKYGGLSNEERKVVLESKGYKVPKAKKYGDVNNNRN